MPDSPPLQLFIVHYHYRPGGVRRVIELALPHLERAMRPRLLEIVLVGGAPPDADWLAGVRRRVRRIPVKVRVEPAMSYLVEQGVSGRVVARRLRLFFKKLFGEGREGSSPRRLVWAHNQGLGRNLLLTRELVRVCAEQGIRLVLHHHDWWFDQRWRCWPEMRRAGFSAPAEVAGALLSSAPNVYHAAINQADFAVLRRHLPRPAGWLPNLADDSPPPAAHCVRAARRWLEERLDEPGAPVWLLPCRLLRRKNIAEALLLARWLRPTAWLLTTAGASSKAEWAYGERLAAAAREQNWRLRLSVLDGNEHEAPPVFELMAASEAVLLTSIQEGFGLPYLESATAGRPLLCRTLPNIAPDLARFGFRFPQSYEEILVDWRLFDGPSERARQTKLFHGWLDTLPGALREIARAPAWLARRRVPRALPFSRLTLTAQLEILTQPMARSWGWCAKLNPFLSVWRGRAARGRLQATRWPRTADRWLSGQAYAKRFTSLIGTGAEPRAMAPTMARPARAQRGAGTDAGAQASVDCQLDLIRSKLEPEFLYPLLWSQDS